MTLSFALSRARSVPVHSSMHEMARGLVAAREPQRSINLTASTTAADDHSGTTRQLTYCFLRLVNLDSGVFERLNRYEAALWRQTVQTLFALHPVGRRF